MRKTVLLLCLLLYMLIPGFAVSEEVHPAGKADRDFYNIGDPITLSFELKGRGYRSAEMGEDYLLPFEVSGKESHYDEKRDITIFKIRGSIFKIGEFTIPPIKLMTEKGDKVESSPVVVIIKSLIDGADGGEDGIKDIKPQVEIDESRPVRLLIPTVIIAGLIILYFVLRKKKAPIASEPEVETDPYNEAIEELRRVEGLNLIKENNIKEHYSLVSDLLRTYLGKIFNINALEMTTFEIMDSLKKRNIEDETGLGSFLNSCDMVKFAKYKAPILDANALAGKARKIIDEYNSRWNMKKSPDDTNGRSDLTKSKTGENYDISG